MYGLPSSTRSVNLINNDTSRSTPLQPRIRSQRSTLKSVANTVLYDLTRTVVGGVDF
jgi:hypothetical protein